jgi:exosortase A
VSSVIDRGVALSGAGAALPHARLRADSRRLEALALVAALLAILAIHLETAASMVEIWRRSDTFAHGWVVPPIALWLGWRRRDALAGVEIKPSSLGLAAIALAGFGWLLAALASVASVAQFALVLTIQATVLTALGWAAARVLLFPLAFLFFAVPAGEFLVPQLMEWTADVTVGALRLTGIPVYREGNHFILPTGSWSVVEACSGIRYLVASVMTGVLYAYLTYRSTRRRLTFVAISIVVPVVANWLRAYLITMLGHLSDGHLAAGVDHLIYGWVFFGVVIGLMFWVGSFWREDPNPGLASPARRDAVGSASRPANGRGTLVAAALAVVAAWVWPIAAATLESTERGPVYLEPIASASGWRATGTRLTAWSPRFIGARVHLHQTFDKEGVGAVGIYVAYYQGQTGGSEVVNSENVLVPSGDREWREVRKPPGTLRWENASVEPVTSELVGRDQRLLAWRFYWISGRVTANDYVAKARLALTKLLGAGDGSAAIVLYTVASEAPAEADDRLNRFAAEMGATVDHALVAGGGRR